LAPVLGGTWIPCRGGKWHRAWASRRSRPGRATVTRLGSVESSARANPCLGGTGTAANRDDGGDVGWLRSLPRTRPTGLGFKRPPGREPRRRASSLAVHRADPTCRLARRDEVAWARRLCTCARDIVAAAPTSRIVVVVAAVHPDCSVCVPQESSRFRSPSWRSCHLPRAPSTSNLSPGLAPLASRRCCHRRAAALASRGRSTHLVSPGVVQRSPLHRDCPRSPLPGALPRPSGKHQPGASRVPTSPFSRPRRLTPPGVAGVLHPAPVMGFGVFHRRVARLRFAPWSPGLANPRAALLPFEAFLPGDSSELALAGPRQGSSCCQPSPSPQSLPPRRLRRRSLAGSSSRGLEALLHRRSRVVAFPLLGRRDHCSPGLACLPGLKRWAG